MNESDPWKLASQWRIQREADFWSQITMLVAQAQVWTTQQVV